MGVRREQQILKANEALGKVIHLSPGLLQKIKVGQFKQHNFNSVKYKQIHTERSQKSVHLNRMAAMTVQGSGAIISW